MTSNRPTNENRLDLVCIEGTCASSEAELQAEQSVSAAMEKPALDNVSEDLMEQIVDRENMEIAWARVRANRGAPGPDGITLAEFPEHFRASWPDIEQQLLNGTYQPGPARRKSIPKEDGSQRHLAIPTVCA
jgi:RNA-directed DNA polymerase